MAHLFRLARISQEGLRQSATWTGAGRVGRILRRYAPALIYSSLTAVVALVLWFAIARPVQVLPRIRPVPPFVLQDQNGQWVDALAMQGQMLVITFSYTRCGADCAQLNDRMLALRAQLAADSQLRNQVALLTISFDTSYDTPATLRRYAAQYAPDTPSWRFLTGGEADVKGIVGGGFGVYYEARPDASPEQGQPTARFVHDKRVVLVDSQGVIRAEYDDARFDPARVLRDIALVQREAASSGVQRQIYEASHLFLCYPD